MITLTSVRLYAKRAYLCLPRIICNQKMVILTKRPRFSFRESWMAIMASAGRTNWTSRQKLFTRKVRPPNIAVGEAVLSARAKKGYTQKQLSEATGIDQSDISKIERGVANPSISTLNKIAMALGMQLYVSIA